MTKSYSCVVSELTAKKNRAIVQDDGDFCEEDYIWILGYEIWNAVDSLISISKPDSDNTAWAEIMYEYHIMGIKAQIDMTCRDTIKLYKEIK